MSKKGSSDMLVSVMKDTKSDECIRTIPMINCSEGPNAASFELRRTAIDFDQSLNLCSKRESFWCVMPFDLIYCYYPTRTRLT